jgi:cytochrome c553
MKRALLTLGLLAVLCAITSAQSAGNATAGKAKADDCAECHGANGEGTEGPRLAGKSETELLKAMQDYKSGKRSDAVMKALLSKLSDQDLADLAAYYASQK